MADGQRARRNAGLTACHIRHMVLALFLALPVSVPLRAQINQKSVDLCTASNPADVVIGACTNFIESGALQSQSMADALTLRGLAFYQTAKYPAALADFLRAAALVPGRAEYYRHVGDARANVLRGNDNMLAITEQLEKAVEDYTRAIRLDPKDAISLVHRGVVYVSLGRVARGLDDMNQAVTLAPDSAEPYEARGRAFNAAGAYRRAVTDFDTALSLQPGLASALLNRGTAYDRMEDYDRAIADFTELIRLVPSNAGAYNNRGTSYAKRGQTDRAIEDFDQALTLDPNLAGTYFNRAQAYYLKGNMDKALADFVQARQLDRQFPEPPADIYESYETQIVPDDSPVRTGPRRPFLDN